MLTKIFYVVLVVRTMIKQNTAESYPIVIEDDFATKMYNLVCWRLYFRIEIGPQLFSLVEI